MENDDLRHLVGQIRETMFATPECSDSPAPGQACIHCMAEQVGLKVEAVIDRERLAR